MRLHVLHNEMIRKVMSFPCFIKSGTLPELLIYWLAAPAQLNRGVSRFLAVFSHHAKFQSREFVHKVKKEESREVKSQLHRSVALCTCVRSCSVSLKTSFHITSQQLGITLQIFNTSLSVSRSPSPPSISTHSPRHTTQKSTSTMET